MMNRLAEEYRKPSLAHVRRNDDGSCAIHDRDEPVRAVTNRLRQAGESDSR